MTNYSFVVPVYRGEKTIGRLFADIKREMDRLRFSFEVIFVWDCGRDNSWSVIQDLCKEFPGVVRGVSLTRNFGQHNAIIAGIDAANGEFIITMDEDLQHSAKDIEKLIIKQKEGDYDLVYGNYSEREHNWFRNITSKIMKKALAVGIPELHPDYTSFRILKTEIAKHTTEMSNSYTFLDGYLSWITSNVASVSVSHSQSEAGSSSYTLMKLINHSINVFVTFSDLPVRFLTVSSFGIFGLSIIYTIYVILRKLIFNDFVSGFATFAIILGFGIGSILMGLGIIGEYIHRINMKSTKRPNFLVRKEVK